MPIVVAQKRAESRARYYTRDEAQRLGWNVRHPSNGGNFLEEQEIVDFFAPLRPALAGGRPDFGIVTPDGLLSAIVECKNEYRDLDTAVAEAIEYAGAMNRIPGFSIRCAVGIAGTPDSLVRTRVVFRLDDDRWVPLTSHEYALTQLPTPDELAIALERRNGTTDVELPSEKEFFDAAIKISNILRLAKIEESARPKAIGAIIVALYHDDFSTRPDQVLEQINIQVQAAVDGFTGIPADRRRFLIQTLSLSTEAHPLRAAIDDVVHQLERLNVRSILRSGVDFLGKFYETFLRYGSSSSGMGVVFTPRHITRLCAELVDIRLGMQTYDAASGTGGFLVAAFDRMWPQATTEEAKRQVKESLHGCETNATVWALAVLNMFFRGDGKSNMLYGSCFDQPARPNRYDRVMLNPPFAQEGEPETAFVDHALGTLRAGGEAAIVLPLGVLVDRKNRAWRSALIERHHVLGVISLPADLFYPTAAPTAILLVRAHAPNNDRGTFLAHIENDGYEISKSRRVERMGSQIPRVLELYRQFIQRGTIDTIPGLACVVSRDRIATGGELVAHRWLPSGPYSTDEFHGNRRDFLRSMTLAVARTPEITEELLVNFERELASGPLGGRPDERAPLSRWFEIVGGRTTDKKNYPAGGVPYLSSGDAFNSIEDFVSPPEAAVFAEPCGSVTGFGQAYIQPWRFCMRGGAGSAPHVLRPKFAMTLSELIWLLGQVNAQRWRFRYGRMATQARLALLELDAPPVDLPIVTGLTEQLQRFQASLDAFYAPGANDDLQGQFNHLVELWKAGRGPTSTAVAMATHPAYKRIISMGRPALPMILKELSAHRDHWFIALGTIAGTNPVRAADRGNVARMADAWVAWGQEQGLLNDVADNVVPEPRQR